MCESSDERSRAHEVKGESDDPENVQTLCGQVEEKYDFDDFGPADMRKMDAREWEAAFDPATWITGDALLDRSSDLTSMTFQSADIGSKEPPCSQSCPLAVINC